jgi:HSP20 family protein
MDQMFNEVLSQPVRRRAGPRLRFTDEGESFELRAPFPGVKDEDIELTVGDDFVTLEVEREPETREGYTALRRERTPTRFERTYRLPERIDTTAVVAKLENGVLVVELPKRVEAKTRTISVNAA